MARVQMAFCCTNCLGWNYPYLRDNMSGNYTIECGGCRHHHYRAVKNGVVTEDRHHPTYGEAHLIIVLPSQFSQEKRPEGRVAKILNLFTAGLAQ